MTRSTEDLCTRLLSYARRLAAPLALAPETEDLAVLPWELLTDCLISWQLRSNYLAKASSLKSSISTESVTSLSHSYRDFFSPTADFDDCDSESIRLDFLPYLGTKSSSGF